MNIPKSWDEVSLDQFIELNQINTDEFNSISSINLERLAILTDTSADDDVWDDMDVREMNRLLTECKYLNTSPKVKANDKILDGKYHKLDFSNLTVGAFIDLEYFTQGNYITNVPKIIAICYRQHRIGEWGEEIVEPYSVINLDKRADEILYNTMTTEVFGIVDEYLSWKTIFVESYQPLFEAEIEDDYDKEELDEEELAELEAIEADEARMRKWSWERLIHKVTQGDIIKSNDVLEMNIIHLFNMLSMTKDLNL
jgi:hypothetical protein